MVAVARPLIEPNRSDALSGSKRAQAVDRWIYFFTAATFVALVLVGFIPTSLDKIAAVGAGSRPPFPLILHAHAVMMGSYLVLMLTQTWLAATGGIRWHMQLGMLAMVIVPALVVVGVMLVPIMYHEVWQAAQNAPPGIREKLTATLLRRENVVLIQIRSAVLFPLFLTIGLLARQRNPGLHKRMMLLATVIILPPAINRMEWLPNTFPVSVVATELYMLLAIAPLFVWDVIRNGYVHKAYLIWAAISLPFIVVMLGLWDTPWWHMIARQMIAP